MGDGEYTQTAAARARVARILHEIDQRHVTDPVCGLCGQRCTRLDDYGLCSKVSVTHVEERARIREEMRTGRRSAL
tara:strand:- start:2177 stop:2404 length:228 start_codon:yes stop_codon:yes gene_type:complete